MVIHAGAARWLVDADIHKADEALRSVEKAGHEALAELASLMASLELAVDGEADQALAPEQTSVLALVDGLASAGLDVELVVEGQPRTLDAGLELSLYRILQEALTNVRKHATGACARVRIGYSACGVDMEVTNDRPPFPAAQDSIPGARLGLVGIAERTALYGGSAEVGPTPDGGFRVRAFLSAEPALAAV